MYLPMRAMNRFFASLLFLLTTATGPAIAIAQDIVVKDGEVTLSKEELAYYMSRWTKQMKESAIQDEGDRLELLNLVLTNKRLAMEADRYAAQNPEFYWNYVAQVEAFRRDLMLRDVRSKLELPDFTALAQEQYTLNRDKYALIPERRISSHILFSSPPGRDRTGVLAEAQAVLDELRAGADFVEMVELHSGEPGAAERAGKFDRWLTFGEIGVAPPYTEGLFEIAEVGQYSELVQTQFGVHIIRLDGIQEKSYRGFDEVKDVIVTELANEYRQLALKDFVAQFQMTEDVIIDAEAVDELLQSTTAAE